MQAKNRPSTSVVNFFSVQNSVDNSKTQTNASNKVIVSSVGTFVTGNSVLTAEIYWALHVIDNHYSFKSCEKVSNLFCKMFPNSEIALKFICGDKFLTTFCIAPYFRSLMLSKVKSEHDYILLFDESLNSHLQTKQLDVHVCFWEEGLVSTWFYTSHFLGHATADDLYEKLRDSCDSFGLRGILQLSMDGPNVNWKTHSMLATDNEEETNHKLLNIGSCGLHVMHNAFRSGSAETEWGIEETLSSLYWLSSQT